MIPARLKFSKGKLLILDQRCLPDKIVYIQAESAADVAKATKDMVLRGAPLIGCAAAYGFALEIDRLSPLSSSSLVKTAEKTVRILNAARPTATALFYATARMFAAVKDFAEENKGNFSEKTVKLLKKTVFAEADSITAEDVEACAAMGRYGADLLPENCVVMTHCNAGALATMGIGTAVGVITTAYQQGKIKHAYSCETRPYLQGARLTIWELMREKVPSELITDNMAAHIIKTCGVNAIVTGADRIASNGDTANKIGTYALAIAAKYHNIPFYIAAPSPTFDMKAESGNDIVIEERSAEEVTTVKGIRIAPKNVRVRHPAFDVTPASLITAIITEKGIISPVTKENVIRMLKK